MGAYRRDILLELWVGGNGLIRREVLVDYLWPVGHTKQQASSDESDHRKRDDAL